MNKTDDKTQAWSKTKIAFYSMLSTLIVLLILLMLTEFSTRLIIHVKYGVPGKTYGLWRYDEVLGAQHRENAYNIS